MGGGGDFDKLDTTSKDRHRGKNDNAGFDHLSVTNKFQPHSQQVEAEQNEEPASDFTGLEHTVYLEAALTMRQTVDTEYARSVLNQTASPKTIQTER